MIIFGPLVIDSMGNKWIGTSGYFGGGGLAKFDGKSWTVYDTSNSHLPNNTVLSVAIDSHSNKWIGTDGGGLAFFNDTTWGIFSQSNSGLVDNQVRCIAIDDSSYKWMGTCGSEKGEGFAVFKNR